MNHPHQHPAARTFGLEEKEIADLRFAATSPLWRYLIADGLVQSTIIAAALLLFMHGQSAPGYHHDGGLLIVGILFLGRIAARTYDWFFRRRLGRQLGYR